MNVYTYLQQDPALPDYSECVDLWAKTWARFGWNPIVLSQDQLVPSPDLTELSLHLVSLPTVNPALYELACFQRWLALPSTGGLMTDFDVLNMGGFKPEDLSTAFDLLFLHADLVPCAVYVAPAALTTIEDMMWNYKHRDAIRVEGKPHCSDQEMFRLLHNRSHITTQPEVTEFGFPGWENYPLVHYSNAALAMRGLKKSDLPKIVTP